MKRKVVGDSMKRREFGSALGMAAAAMFLSGRAAFAESEGKRPNIIFL